MTIASRLPAFVLLGLVVVGAVLLVIGYGVAVGVGVIVGLLLGASVVMAFVVLNQRSRSSTMLYGIDKGATRNWPDHGLIERYGRESMRVAGVDSDALRRVIAVGRSVDAGGVRVELVAVEIREDGGVATIVAHARPPVGQVGSFAEVAVADERSTSYFASGQLSGGMVPGTGRLEIRFAPAPPLDARELVLQIVSFIDPFSGSLVQVDGPWEFRIEL